MRHRLRSAEDKHTYNRRKPEPGGASLTFSAKKEPQAKETTDKSGGAKTGKSESRGMVAGFFAKRHC